MNSQELSNITRKKQKIMTKFIHFISIMIKKHARQQQIKWNIKMPIFAPFPSVTFKINRKNAAANIHFANSQCHISLTGVCQHNFLGVIKVRN